jgi:hypothetical protein
MDVYIYQLRHWRVSKFTSEDFSTNWLLSKIHRSCRLKSSKRAEEEIKKKTQQKKSKKTTTTTTTKEPTRETPIFVDLKHRCSKAVDYKKT